MTKQVETDYQVYCHRCPVKVPVLWRSQATLHGNHEWGALWHCPNHADDCSREPHGEYCDANCQQGEESVDGGTGLNDIDPSDPCYGADPS